MILDPDKTVSDYTDDEQAEIVEEVRVDWLAAEDNRKQRQEIALEDYELYMRERRDAEKQADEREGWSKLEIPMVYWTIEHQLPRLGVDPPRVTVKALNAESVPYAKSKELRLNYYVERCGWDLSYQMVARSKLIIGDGIAMVPWSPSMHMPRVMHVDWFDFFVSAECTVFEDADCHFHRTFWTKRGMDELSGELDEEDRPIWSNLDEVPQGSRRSQVDETWARRRGLNEQGNDSGGQADTVTPFVSCWYSTGEYVVLGGPDYSTLIRAQMSPYRRRVHHPGIPSKVEFLRPFVFFRNIPDLTGPYSLSEARALGDGQIEMSTLRNQAIDQISLDINAPVVHDESIPDSKVRDAFSRPKGRIPVPFGPSGPLIQRMPAGQPSAGLPMIYDQIRNESQLISGMNDNAAGQAVNGEQTATEIQTLAAAASQRILLKRKMDEIGMKAVAQQFDYRDRQYGGILLMEIPAGVDPAKLRGFRAATPDAMDTSSLMSGNGPGAGVAGGFVEITPASGGPGLEYEVSIESGSAVRADQTEEAQRVGAFVAGLQDPEIRARVDWDEIARTYISAYGFAPERLYRTPPPPPPGVPDAPVPQTPTA